MEPWQIGALTFGIMGWFSIMIMLLILMKIAKARTDLAEWQAEFEESDVPTSDRPLDSAG